MRGIGVGKGRPRLPTQMKEARGTIRPSRENRSEPQLAAIILPLPPAKGFTKQERHWWVRLAAAIDPMRVATEADIASFELLVIAYARAHKLKNAKNIYAWAAATKLAVQMLGQFGLTPALRPKVSSIGKPPKKEDDPLTAFRSPTSWGQA